MAEQLHKHSTPGPTAVGQLHLIQPDFKVGKRICLAKLSEYVEFKFEGSFAGYFGRWGCTAPILVICSSRLNCLLSVIQSQCVYKDT